jgi:hypothetical protein
VCPASRGLSVPWADDEESLDSPGECQRYERNDTLKRTSAQVDHKAGSAKKLEDISLVL